MTQDPSPVAGATAHLDSWDAFWRFYVREHRDPRTRRLHFAGTSLAILCLVAAVVLRNVWLAVAAPIVAYGFAWGGHFAVERNTPATFRHPLRSLMADARMFALMCMGRMDDEVKRIAGDSRNEAPPVG
jgi:hypothetical protein